ncbi:MAG: hypothetical protein KC440_07690 [Nitrosarchaeum sp.]|nr:hypothetical protein [Nitrosarchaeum sp.]
MILLELKKFVKEALTNIVDGVEMANKEHQRFQISGSYHSGKDVSGEYVEFDVSVTTQNKTEVGAKGKFGIFVVGGQIGGSKESNDESINRIKFKVFITEK